MIDINLAYNEFKELSPEKESWDMEEIWFFDNDLSKKLLDEWLLDKAYNFWRDFNPDITGWDIVWIELFERCLEKIYNQLKEINDINITKFPDCSNW